ncbi:LysE family transporter [Stappia sp. GBMRC 2046]|uniref:LysE family transporter n=1 Tax=Stappia sediminis TaxID=2692190 RepID=A0A7X3LVT2_9HYPH|nr:LysE family transporter [Stappia sediminis]MXN66034.1 LysE family transporter [Stappia sediminis]
MLELVPLAIGIVLAQVSPGPNMMAVSSASLSSGRRAGIRTAAGVAAGVLVWALLFSLGIGALIEAYPGSITAMKVIGGGYLLYLGLKALKASFRPARSNGGPQAAATPSPKAFRTGMLVVLTNPKAALMWVAISLFLASASGSELRFLVIGFAASLSALLVYGAYAVLFSTGFATRAYGRFFRWIEGTFGALFGALGAKLLIDGLKEARG